MGSAFTIRLPFVRTRSTDGRGAWAGSSSGCREAAPRPALRIEDLHRGVGDRGQSLWRLLEHSPQFACAGLIIYTDVRGEGVKTRLCAAARQPSRVALSDKCRSTCGSGYGSELTRRGGGDHGQRQKRVWGAKAPTAPKLHKRLHRCRAAYVRSEYI